MDRPVQATVVSSETRRQNRGHLPSVQPAGEMMGPGIPRSFSKLFCVPK